MTYTTDFTLLPFNIDYFQRLLAFAKPLFSFLEEHKIPFVIYGSFALFYYTKNTRLAVHDIDIMMHKQDYPKLVSYLQSQDILFEQSGDDFFIRHDDLLIEIDSWGLGDGPLAQAIAVKEITAYGQQLPLVTLQTLETIYNKAKQDSTNTDTDKILQRISYLEQFLKRQLHD